MRGAARGLRCGGHEHGGHEHGGHEHGGHEHGGHDTADTNTADTDTAADTEIVMTLEELSEYDGQDGRPAYIAVDSVIYDVSDVSFWANGSHNGFSAGNDLTEEIKTISPHGVSKLKGLTVVGRLED